jgi:hypothetical protein
VALAALCLLGACASKDVVGYGVGPQAERAAMAQQANRDPAPDTPGMYLGLIDQMQSQGLYFASLAHIDAYEKQYGASPDTILLRADALRPTDAVTLSDLGYAKLRDGDVNGARVPLMKAAELDQNNPKIVSNMVLYLLANGDQAQALAVMNQQKFTPDVRAAIRSDGAKVAAAGRAQTRGSQAQPQQQFGQAVAGTGTVASAQGIEPAPRLLQRFAQ